VAHSLKGAVGLFGKTPAYRLAQELETLAHTGQLTGASATLERLVQEMEQISQALIAMDEMVEHLS
jgi:HPt (histidine-containing phosphotransfer) domain-containing protein